MIVSTESGHAVVISSLAIEDLQETVVRLGNQRDEALAEVERFKETLDMVAEERDAWRARALGLPQEPCRHADHPSAPDAWES